MFKKTVALMILACSAAAFIFLVMDRKKEMPLEIASTAGFQEASSRAMKDLMDDGKGMSSPVMAALAFQAAVKELGFDPELTLTLWISDAYQEQLRGGNPAHIVNNIRMSDRLVATALGDLAPEEDFNRILRFYSEEFGSMARSRRAARP